MSIYRQRHSLDRCILIHQTKVFSRQMYINLPDKGILHNELLLHSALLGFVSRQQAEEYLQASEVTLWGIFKYLRNIFEEYLQASEVIHVLRRRKIWRVKKQQNLELIPKFHEPLSPAGWPLLIWTPPMFEKREKIIYDNFFLYAFLMINTNHDINTGANLCECSYE